MKKTKLLYNNYKFYIITAFVFLVAEWIYISNSFVNAPIGDYMEYICHFAAEDLKYGISFSTIWDADNGVHRAPVQVLYLLANVRILGYQPMIELYVGATFRIAIAFLLFDYTLKQKKDEIPTKIIWLFILLCFFNLNQWELYCQEFAASTATRVFLFCFSFIQFDLLTMDPKEYRRINELGIILVFTITMASGAYFASFALTSIIVLGLKFVLDFQKKRWKNLCYYLFIFFYLMLGVTIYLNGLELNIDLESNEKLGILRFLLDYITGVWTFLGTCVLGSFGSEKLMFEVIGCLIFLFTIAWMMLYIIKEKSKAHLFPIAMILYGFSTMGLIYVGRAEMYGSSYAFQSRYTVESTFVLIGVSYIFYHFATKTSWKEFLFNAEKGQKKQPPIRMVKKSIVSSAFIVSAIIMFILIVPGIIGSNGYQQCTAKYRKAYYQQNVEKMDRLEELTEEGFESFQTDKDTAVECIEILKRYHLGPYRYN